MFGTHGVHVPPGRMIGGHESVTLGQETGEMIFVSPEAGSLAKWG